MALNLMALNDNKAGMGELDKERINAIILENSKGSKFFENQQRKTRQLQKRIEEKLAQRDKISPAMIKKGEAEADVIIRQIEAGRILSRSILHVDMDAFYAAVEMRDDASLRSKPMAVGGMSMLSTSNYVARRFGVRAAMPGFIAKKLCPNLTIVPCNFAKYSAASREVRAILAVYDSDFAPMSLDEAYLDLTEHLRARADLSEQERTFGNRHECRCDEWSEEARKAALSNDPESACRSCMAALDGKPRTFGFTFGEAARELRWRIFDATQLTASAGLAPNCLLAKIASDRQKPNGQFQVGTSEDDIALFVRALPVRKIPGIGNVSEQMLKALGVINCSDIYEQRGLLYHLSTPCNFRYYLRVAMGDGDTEVSNDGERKSMSVERTFPEMKKAAELLEKCRELSDALAEDLRESRMRGRTVTLKAKLVSFEVKTRAQTLPHVTRDPELVAAAAAELLRNEINAAFPEPLRLRLMGVRMSGLVSDDMAPENGQQLSLKKAFEAAKGKREEPGQVLPSSDNAAQPSSSFFEKFKKDVVAAETSEVLKPKLNDLEQKPLEQKEQRKSSSFFERFKKDKEVAAESSVGLKPKSNEIELKSLEAKPNQPSSSFFERSKKDEDEGLKPKSYNLEPKYLAAKEKSSVLLEEPKEGKIGKCNVSERNPTPSLQEEIPTTQPQDSILETSGSKQAPAVFFRKKQRVERPASPVFGGTPQLPTNSPPPSNSWNGVSCPVCGRMQLVQNEQQFHSHLDFCLSRGAISEAIREAEEEAPPQKRSKLALKERQSDRNARPILKYFSKTTNS